MAVPDRKGRRTFAYFGGAVFVLLIIVAAILIFDATEPEGVPAPDGTPSVDAPN